MRSPSQPGVEQRMFLQRDGSQLSEEIGVGGDDIAAAALNWLRRLTRLVASAVVVNVTGAVVRWLANMRSAIVRRIVPTSRSGSQQDSRSRHAHPFRECGPCVRCLARPSNRHPTRRPLVWCSARAEMVLGGAISNRVTVSPAEIRCPITAPTANVSPALGPVGGMRRTPLSRHSTSSVAFSLSSVKRGSPARTARPVGFEPAERRRLAPCSSRAAEW